MLIIYITDRAEVWRDIYINDVLTPYSVSTHGRVMNRTTSRILSPRSHTSGYLQVSLYIDGSEHRWYIHRLVLYVFKYIDNWKDMQVNHIDGDKTNNNILNLEWVTNSENQIHAHKTGLKRHIYGEDRARAKHSNDEIYNICKMISSGQSTKYITEMFNITDKELISDLRNHRRWKDITSQFTFKPADTTGENNGFASITNNDAHTICKELSDGLSVLDIHNKYGYSKDVIYKIKHRKTWKLISDKYNF